MDSVRLHHKFLENETDENKNKCTKQEIILESQKVNFSTIYTKEWLNKKKQHLHMQRYLSVMIKQPIRYPTIDFVISLKSIKRFDGRLRSVFTDRLNQLCIMCSVQTSSIKIYFFVSHFFLLKLCVTLNILAIYIRGFIKVFSYQNFICTQ